MAVEPIRLADRRHRIRVRRSEVENPYTFLGVRSHGCTPIFLLVSRYGSLQIFARLLGWL